MQIAFAESIISYPETPDWEQPLLFFSKVLGQRGPAGSQRPAFTPTHQSPCSVLLEIILTYWNIHLYRGTVSSHSEMWWVKSQRFILLFPPVFFLGNCQSYSALATRENNWVLWELWPHQYSCCLWGLHLCCRHLCDDRCPDCPSSSLFLPCPESWHEDPGCHVPHDLSEG